MTQPQAPLQGWTWSPDGRGTLDIIWTCLFTLTICCFTVVHKDILPPSTGEWKRFRDKTVCLFLGIIAPEAVLALAFGDWMAARKPLPNGMGSFMHSLRTWAGLRFMLVMRWLWVATGVLLTLIVTPFENCLKLASLSGAFQKRRSKTKARATLL